MELRVGDLIEILEGFNPDAVVRIQYQYDHPIIGRLAGITSASAIRAALVREAKEYDSTEEEVDDDTCVRAYVGVDVPDVEPGTKDDSVYLMQDTLPWHVRDHCGNKVAWEICSQ